MVMMQHELMKGVHVVPKYNVDTLGAPFGVTLVDSVSVSLDQTTGEERVNIPDLIGLINTVVRSRVLHPRKLSGSELKFIRKALGVRAKPLAEFLDMSAEHFSRCEAGKKAMSGSHEKLFRLAAFMGTFFEDPKEMFVQRAPSETMKTLEGKKREKVENFVQMFFGMKIQSVFDVSEPLHFTFSRRPTLSAHEDDDGEWNSEPPLKVA